MNNQRRRRNNRNFNRRRRRNTNNSSSQNLIVPFTKVVHLQSVTGETFINTNVVSFSYNLLDATSPTVSFTSGYLGFSQWMGFYERYQILHATFQIFFLNFATEILTAVAYPSTDPLIATTTFTASSMPNSRTQEVSALTANSFVKMTVRIDPTTVVGRVLSDIAYTGDSLEPPTETVYLHLVVDKANVIDDVENLTIKVLTKIRIKFYQRKLIGFATPLNLNISKIQDDRLSLKLNVSQTVKQVRETKRKKKSTRRALRESVEATVLTSPNSNNNNPESRN
jgi:hypothetical protein